MASLESSLRLKAAGAKAPAKSGARPLVEADLALDEGKSGGIAKSKQVKNAGSTSPVSPKNSRDVDFITRIGGSSQSDKTVRQF